MHVEFSVNNAIDLPTEMNDNENPPSDFPLFVSIGARGLGPAYMGPDHAPFAVENPIEAVRLINGLRKQRKALRQLEEFSSKFDRQHFDSGLQRRQASMQRVERMLTTPFVKNLDVEKASESDLACYGGTEFGRTPQINSGNSRDHFPNITPVVLGGGGIRGGHVAGKTNSTGLEIADSLATVPDWFATLLASLDIDPAHEFRTELGAIAPSSPYDKPIQDLIV